MGTVNITHEKYRALLDAKEHAADFAAQVDQLQGELEQSRDYADTLLAPGGHVQLVGKLHDDLTALRAAVLKVDITVRWNAKGAIVEAKGLEAWDAALALARQSDTKRMDKE